MKIKNKKYLFIKGFLLIVVVGVLPFIVFADSRISKSSLKNREVKSTFRQYTKNIYKYRFNNRRINFCEKNISKNIFREKFLCASNDEIDYQYFYCSDHDDCFEQGSGNWGIQNGIMVYQSNGDWNMINSAACTNPANSVHAVDCGGSTR